MKYKFNDTVRLFKCCGIDIIGDIGTGTIIGLDAEGALFVDKIYHEDTIEPTTEKEQLLIQELTNSGFFNNTKEKNINMAYFHITSKCNLKCIGCYSDEENRNSKNDLSTQQCIKIIDNLNRAKVKTLIISGGEPFLRNDLPDILKYAKQQCKIQTVQVVSNGMIDRVKYLEVLPYIDSLSISVDGYDEKSSFLRNSNMEYVLETVKYLSSMTQRVCMIFTLNAKNIPFISKYIKLSNTLHVPFTFSVLTVENSDEFAPFCLGKKEYDILKEIEKHQDLPIDDVTQGNYIGCKQTCGLGRQTISIASNGDVYPCHMLQNYSLKFGNALCDELLLLSSTKINFWNVDNIDECKKCDYKYICGGGCYARRYFTCRDMKMSHDPCCELYKNDISRIISELKENV